MATEKILIPTADSVMTPVLERLYLLRPRAFQHLNLAGPAVWHHPILGYRAQAAFILKRLADRASANRLATATGQDLKEYVASEYDAVPNTDNTGAIGEASFVRPIAIKSGDIPKGSRLRRTANLDAQVPLLAADYETLVDLHFDVGQLTAGPIAVQATRAGAHANHPITVVSNTAIDGSVGTAVMKPARTLAVNTEFSQATYLAGSTVVVTGTNSLDAVISETFTVSLADGGETILGSSLFKTVTGVVIGPQQNDHGIFSVGVQSDSAAASAIKTSVASSTSVKTYAGTNLNGSIGTSTMKPARKLTATLSSSVGSYISTSKITFSGLDSNGVSASESVNVSMPNGGSFVSTTGLFSSVSSISIEAQNDTSGSFSFGINTDAANDEAIVSGATKATPHGVSIQNPFDKFITVSTFSAAGGSDIAKDDYVKDYARAFAVGQYGPTEAASRLGVLRATGARKVLVFDIPGTGTEQILVGDSSWASSTGWVNAVQQSLYDGDLIGVGCKVVVAGITNKVVSIVALVELRDKNYLNNTVEIDNAIRTAVAAYLNDRKDWNVWTNDGLQAAITRAHSKIFNCSSAVMKDSTNATIPEIVTPDYTQTQYHYYLANGAVKITYSGPS